MARHESSRKFHGMAMNRHPRAYMTKYHTYQDGINGVSPEQYYASTVTALDHRRLAASCSQSCNINQSIDLMNNFEDLGFTVKQSLNVAS